MLLEKILEVHAIHVLHDHEVLAPQFYEVVGLEDICVDEVGYQASFAYEIAAKLLDGREFPP